MTITLDIIQNKLKRAAIKGGMNSAEVQPFVDAVAFQFNLNELGKPRNAAGLSPKKLVAKTRSTRPEIFSADALAKTAEPFNPATADATKKSRNPYRWPEGPRRDAAIVALMSGTPSSMLHTLSKAAGCSVSGKPLAKK